MSFTFIALSSPSDKKKKKIERERNFLHEGWREDLKGKLRKQPGRNEPGVSIPLCSWSGKMVNKKA